MNRRYLKKPPKEKETIRGAYDKDGKWWNEENIIMFTGGMVKMCFGKEKQHIKIIEREK